MKKTLCYILVFLLICMIAGCVSDPGGNREPTENTTAPTSVQTDTTDGSEDPSTSAGATQTPSVPDETEPPQSLPQETQPQPSMPDIGTDPGGFGPIF